MAFIGMLSTKTKRLGTLKLAMCSRDQACNSSELRFTPGRAKMYATPISPRRGSGVPTTATWAMSSRCSKMFSISAG